MDPGKCPKQKVHESESACFLVRGGEKGEGFGKKLKKNAIRPFFIASGHKNIGATIRIGREIRCLLYAGFLILAYN